MRYKMAKNINFVVTRYVFSSSKCTKIRFCPGLRPDPAGGDYDAPSDPLVGWGGGYPLLIPLPARRLRRLERRLGSQAPSTQNSGYATECKYRDLPSNQRMECSKIIYSNPVRLAYVFVCFCRFSSDTE